MRIDTLLIGIAFAAGMLCTACIGPATAPAEEESAKKEMVSDVQGVQDDKADAAVDSDAGTVLAKRAAGRKVQ
jgi:hypothetical protein